MNDALESRPGSQESELVSLRRRVAELEQFEAEIKAAHLKLAEKEEFNFALFAPAALPEPAPRGAEHE